VGQDNLGIMMASGLQIQGQTVGSYFRQKSSWTEQKICYEGDKLAYCLSN